MKVLQVIVLEGSQYVVKTLGLILILVGAIHTTGSERLNLGLSQLCTFLGV